MMRAPPLLLFVIVAAASVMGGFVGSVLATTWALSAGATPVESRTDLATPTAAQNCPVISKVPIESRCRQPSLAELAMTQQQYANDDCRITPSMTPANGLHSETLYDSYIRAVESFVASEMAFSTFKRNDDYRFVLEHVTQAQGEQYLELAEKWLKNKDLDAKALPLESIASLDALGNPYRHKFKLSAGLELEVSPTMMRYIWYAMAYTDHIRSMGFAESNALSIVEIGAGYAGQYCMMQLLFPLLKVRIERYTIFDLGPIQQLQMKYVQWMGLLDGVLTWSNATIWKPHQVDLMVSNYALSEISPRNQRIYWTQVAPFASHGYIVKNAPLMDCKAAQEALAKAKRREPFLKEFRGGVHEVIMW